MEIRGYWWDKFEFPDGSIEITEKRPNTFMDSGRVLAALLFGATLKPETLEGVLWHAFGHGDSGWGSSPPDPATTETNLLDEFCRYQPGTVTYESPTGSVARGSRTSAIKFETVIPSGAQANQDVREHALFGGDATATLDSGWMINLIRHDVISIPPTGTWTRYIQLEF